MKEKWAKQNKKQKQNKNSATTVGVIVRVEKESLRIIDQNGTVRSVRVQEITRRIGSKFVSVDNLRNNIKEGDAVTVRDGPHKVLNSRKGKEIRKANERISK